MDAHWLSASSQPLVRRSWDALAGPQIFNIKTFAVKFMSCAASVGAGLPVGPEGPMISMGALVSGPTETPQPLRPHQQDAQRPSCSCVLGDASAQVGRLHTWPAQGIPLAKRAAIVAGRRLAAA